MTAAPARASFTGVAPSRPSEPRRRRPPRRPLRRRRRTTRSPAGCDPEAVDGDHHEQRGAGVDAEDPGSARGLRATPCITAPARPSAAPTSRPDEVRGNAQRADDQMVVERRVVVEQRIDHGAEGDRLGPDGDRSTAPPTPAARTAASSAGVRVEAPCSRPRRSSRGRPASGIPRWRPAVLTATRPTVGSPYISGQPGGPPTAPRLRSRGAGPGSSPRRPRRGRPAASPASRPAPPRPSAGPAAVPGCRGRRPPRTV